MQTPPAALSPHQRTAPDIEEQYSHLVAGMAERVRLLGASRLAPPGPPFGRYLSFVAVEAG